MFNSCLIGRKKKVVDADQEMIIEDAALNKPKEVKSGSSHPAKKKKFLQIRDDKAFQLYIFRVLKQVKPELGISKLAMQQCNQIVADLFERIMDESRKLTLFNKKCTLSSKEIETAVKLLFNGELSKHAVHEGRQSISKFLQKSAL
jgi:histone H2B